MFVELTMTLLLSIASTGRDGKRQYHDMTSKNHTMQQDMLACHNMSNALATIAACTRFLETNSSKLSPGKAHFHVDRGNAYLINGQIQKAIADFDKALSLNPRSPRAWFFRGVTRGKLKQYQLAINDYSEAIRLKPDFVEAYFNRGTAYGRLHDFSSAIVDLSTVIRARPTFIKAYTNRGTAYALNKQIKKALDDFDKAIELDPVHPVVRLNRASIYRQQGKRPQATSDYMTGFQNSRTSRIRLLQKRLKTSGHYNGRLNGRFDQATRQALEKCLQTHIFNPHKL